jgi:hypothetical protein
MQVPLSLRVGTHTLLGVHAKPESASPLAATLARVGAIDESVRYVAGRPAEAGWFLFADALADEALFDEWFGAIRDANGGRDAVAASFLASWLAGIVIEPVTVAIVRERRAWSVAAGDLLVHRHEDGWFDGLAIQNPTLILLPGDEDAGHRDAVVVEDAPALRSSVAAEIATTLGQIFRAVRRRARLGLPVMWGAMADSAGYAAVADAAARGCDREAAFAEAMVFVDAIAEVAAMPRVRPSLVQVAWSGGVSHEIARGTCCLWYRTQVDPDPMGEGFCSFCPRRDPDDRRRRWAAGLEEEAAG